MSSIPPSSTLSDLASRSQPVGTGVIGGGGAPGGGTARPMRLADVFGSVESIVVGRTPDCSIYLPHPTVSVYHAILERKPDGNLLLQDLDSGTGVFVNGRRRREPTIVQEYERFGIGPYIFWRVGEHLYSLDSSQSLRLEARKLEKSVRLAKGGQRKLLDDINLVVKPGEFVTLLGPSGSGKSTLMDCLNGRRRATGGRVLANGEDFYEEFDNFRQSLGYVPQKDIVHTQLSVYRALFYTARLRLPTDTAPDELEGRIQEVMRQMELVPHQNTLVGQLSGGQIKRVSLGAELLARPSLLYIDEATSGLDAGTEARMMRLFRTLADEGKSIICITHALDNVDECHLLLVLAGGKMVYFGPPDECLGYFGVKHLNQVYDRLGERELAAWEADYRATRLYREFVEERVAETDAGIAAEKAAQHAQADEKSIMARIDPPDRGNGDALEAPSEYAADAASGEPKPAPAGGLLAYPAAIAPMLKRRIRRLSVRYRGVRRVFRPITRMWHQFRVLTNRYVELILHDPRSLRLLLLQAPIVGIFLLIGFMNKPYQETMPVVRPLEENEQQMVAQLSAWNIVVARDDTLDDTQRGKLDRMRFKIVKGGIEQEISGRELHARLQSIYNPDMPLGELKQRLGDMEMHLVDSTPKATVRGNDLLDTLHKLGRSKMAEVLATTKKPVVLVGEITDPRYTYILLNIVAITIFWFGVNNSAKEIVKEEPIYARERAVNLGITAYLGSKFLVLSITSALQTLTLMGIVYGLLRGMQAYYGHAFPPPEYFLPFGPQFAVLALLSIVGVAVGLTMSACVSSPDRATAMLPYVLIPQIILGGAIIPVKGEPITTLAAVLAPVNWAFRAIHRGADKLPPYHPLQQAFDWPVSTVCWILGGQLVVLLAATAWFMKRKDVWGK